MITTTPKRVHAGMADLAPGERRIIPHGKQTVGLFNIGGRYHAVLNFCPHEGAELCKGKLTGTTMPTTQPGTYEWGRENHILRCPWHQWEFDIETGRHLANPSCRIRVYRVIQEEDQLYLETSP